MSQDDQAALALVKATSTPIHDIGTAIYLSPETFALGAEWGWTNPFGFYFAGRGGMLGDVSADVVHAALGWFHPAAVKAMYEEGAGVAGSVEAARRMAEAHGIWGSKHLADIEDIGGLAKVTEELVDNLEGSGIPLFAGWRNAARSDDDAGRMAQLMQILREWRGGLHLVATTAVGLTPLEAILTNEGEGQAKFFGWSAPFPDCSAIKHKSAEAEAITDELCTQSLSRALSQDNFAAFEAGVAAALAAST
jgi:hypothetical protein